MNPSPPVIIVCTGDASAVPCTSTVTVFFFVFCFVLMPRARTAGTELFLRFFMKTTSNGYKVGKGERALSLYCKTH